MKNKGLIIIALVVVAGFLFLKKKVVTPTITQATVATGIPIPADNTTPQQNTVIQFPLATAIQDIIDTTVPDTYNAPPPPPPGPNEWDETLQ